MSSPRNLLTEWSRLIAVSLASCGIRDVIVSPGSRTTPFVLALRDRPELRLTSVIDERSAAFVALGLARATGRAAAVLATSGTAPAHWLPAVIEASIAQLPMVLLSANRPLSLANAGAAQTIDQTKLFGGWVRSFVDLGDPRDDDAALASVPRSIAQSVALAHGPTRGPVHLDLHADKPLEPIAAESDDESALVARVQSITSRAITQVSTPASAADGAFADRLGHALARSKRPLLVGGPRTFASDRDAILATAARLGLVVCAEAASGLRFGPRSATMLDASEVLFSSARFARDHAPDLVVQVGSFPTAPTLERVWTNAAYFVLEAGGVHDPVARASAISTAPAGPTLELVKRTSEVDAAWRERMVRADALAWSEVERLLASGRGEGAIVRAAVRASGSAPIVIGNSLPIRTLDRFVPGGGASRDVFSQRGASGIDGLISGAIGASLGGGGPVLAIIGDVSFLHDVGALATLASLRRPLVIVVIDNRGGRIFESLPLAGRRDLAAAMPLFTTPHEVDVATVARAFGVRCLACDDASDVARAVADGIASDAPTLVWAHAEPGEARASFASLCAAFDQAFHGGEA
jgi:2-succinyl-5-enolpyruvyl-6-hydroxy-3-cyclohexene-1-carboxylate synthase